MEVFPDGAILLEFTQPIKGRSVHLVEDADSLQEPVGIQDAVRASWDEDLKLKQEELAGSGDLTRVGPYHEPISGNDLNALYEATSTRRVMWSGPLTTLRAVKVGLTEDPEAFLYVAQTHYAYTTALSKEEVKRLYIEQGIERPRPPLAISTFAITPDEEIILTVRGNRTNKYPNTRYGQGGDPQTPDVDPVEHQVREMKQEILLEPTAYDPRDIEFIAIVEDNNQLPGKTDLIGRVRINKTFREIQEAVARRERHPNDAVAVASIPADADGLLKHLATVNPADYCTPAYIGLIAYGKMEYGIGWYRELSSLLI